MNSVRKYNEITDNEADGTMRHSPETRMTRTIVACSIVSTSG